MKTLDEYERVLLIDMESEEIYPFSLFGFEFGSGSIDELKKRAKKSIFLGNPGRVFGIESILVPQKDMFSFAKRKLGLSYKIDVTTCPVEISLNQLKLLIKRGMKFYKLQVLEPDDSWSLAQRPLEEIERKIEACNGFFEILEVLELPPATDCLDQL